MVLPRPEGGVDLCEVCTERLGIRAALLNRCLSPTVNKDSLFRFSDAEMLGRQARSRVFALAMPALLILTLVAGPLPLAQAQTPDGLREAVEHGDTAGVERLLANARGDQHAAADTYALIWSAYYGRTDLLNALLKRGVPATACDARGWTALLAAVKGNQPESAAILMAHGADPEAHPKDGGASAATLASELGRTAVLERLHRAGSATPKVNAETSAAVVQKAGGAAPVDATLAAPRLDPAQLSDSLLAAAKRNDPAAVKTLLAQGAKAQTCNKLGWPVSVLAASRGYTEVLRLLFERDHAVVSQSSPDGRWDPFMEAATNGHMETTRFLLNHSAFAAVDLPKANAALEYIDTREDKEMARMLRGLIAKLPPGRAEGAWLPGPDTP